MGCGCQLSSRKRAVQHTEQAAIVYGLGPAIDEGLPPGDAQQKVLCIWSAVQPRQQILHRPVHFRLARPRAALHAHAHAQGVAVEGHAGAALGHYHFSNRTLRQLLHHPGPCDNNRAWSYEGTLVEKVAQEGRQKGAGVGGPMEIRQTLVQSLEQRTPLVRLFTLRRCTPHLQDAGSGVEQGLVNSVAIVHHLTRICGPPQQWNMDRRLKQECLHSAIEGVILEGLLRGGLTL
mmetsp:Transcript_12243/g.20783  ORF Transcript_12243/g.20783 Transcript_12243/m.20783 type:complete len:233 (-) Transcript_12243:398-1096(-)